MGQAKRQREAINAIQKLGGSVHYDYEETAPRTVSSSGKAWEPEWLLKLLGEDFFHKPVNLTLFGSPKDEGWVKAVNNLPSLKTLLMSGGNVSDETLENLAELPNLEELHASSSSVSDTGLRNLKKFPNLRWLVIHYAKVTDSGLVHVQNLRHLEELVLTGNNVSDAAIPNLSSITTLKLLDVRQTAITANGWDELKKDLPNCNVMWQAK
jgi:Leucine-rich repeat (LRR) protein